MGFVKLEIENFLKQQNFIKISDSEDPDFCLDYNFKNNHNMQHWYKYPNKLYIHQDKNDGNYCELYFSENTEESKIFCLRNIRSMILKHSSSS